MEDLKKLRQEIDKTDKKLLKLLSERFLITEKVGQYKAKRNLKSRDEKREKEIFEKRKEMAEELGLSSNLVEKIFRLIIKKVRQNHQKLFNEEKRRQF